MSESDFEKPYKEKPFVDVNIAEIQKPGKYRIVGKIAEIKDLTILLDDGYEQITIILPENISVDLKEGLQIRALGYVELHPEKQMRGSFIQNFNGVDLEVYKQINELEQSLRRVNT
ncbi:MAG: hypothetical protein ACTSSN_01555 [Candidatus Heimdallarchaeaceae archaeon]